MPETFSEVQVAGTDTDVFQFQQTDVRLTVEFGIYADLPETIQNEADFQRELVRVNGQSGELISYKTPDSRGEMRKFIALNLKKVASSSSLTIWAQYENEPAKDIVLGIFSSIRLR